jgi:hypothetical protein
MQASQFSSIIQVELSLEMNVELILIMLFLLLVMEQKMEMIISLLKIHGHPTGEIKVMSKLAKTMFVVFFRQLPILLRDVAPN